MKTEKIRIVLDRLCADRELTKKAYAELDKIEADAELGRYVRMFFELPLSYMVPSTYARAISNVVTLIKWGREQEGKVE